MRDNFVWLSKHYGLTFISIILGIFFVKQSIVALNIDIWSDIFIKQGFFALILNLLSVLFPDLIYALNIQSNGEKSGKYLIVIELLLGMVIIAIGLSLVFLGLVNLETWLILCISVLIKSQHSQFALAVNGNYLVQYRLSLIISNSIKLGLIVIFIKFSQLNVVQYLFVILFTSSLSIIYTLVKSKEAANINDIINIFKRLGKSSYFKSVTRSAVVNVDYLIAKINIFADEDTSFSILKSVESSVGGGIYGMLPNIYVEKVNKEIQNSTNESRIWVIFKEYAAVHVFLFLPLIFVIHPYVKYVYGERLGVPALCLLLSLLALKGVVRFLELIFRANALYNIESRLHISKILFILLILLISSLLKTEILYLFFLGLIVAFEMINALWLYEKVRHN